MKLSTRTRYGIRALIEIALHGSGRPVDLNEISQHQDISKKYLHSLMVTLKNNGLVTSVRGNTGGYLLAKAPREITMLDVFTALEGPADLVECVDDESRCSRTTCCSARTFWKHLSEVMQDEMRKTTLEDLTIQCATSLNEPGYEI
jgi:Rrf2 family transcriptional regulator, cysteine metabolism repressor